MASKHNKQDLAQMQSLPLQAKIIMTQQRIRQWYDYWDGMVYVSFSGGKDSTVLKHIVDGMYDDVPAVFVNTGLEFPEIQKFATSQPNVVVLRPKLSFTEVLKNYGYPVGSKRISQVVRLARPGTTRWDLLHGTGVTKTGEKAPLMWSNGGFLLMPTLTFPNDAAIL